MSTSIPVSDSKQWIEPSAFLSFRIPLLSLSPLVSTTMTTSVFQCQALEQKGQTQRAHWSAQKPKKNAKWRKKREKREKKNRTGQLICKFWSNSWFLKEKWRWHPKNAPEVAPTSPRRLPRRFPGGSPEVPRRFPGRSPEVPGGSPEVAVPRRFPGSSRGRSPEVPRRSQIFERFFGGSLASPDSLQIFRNSSEAPGNFQKTELADENAPAWVGFLISMCKIDNDTDKVPKPEMSQTVLSNSRDPMQLWQSGLSKTNPQTPPHSFCILYCNEIPTHGKVLVRRFATTPKAKSGEKRKQGPSWPMQVCSVCGIKVVPWTPWEALIVWVWNSASLHPKRPLNMIQKNKKQPKTFDEAIRCPMRVLLRGALLWNAVGRNTVAS